MKQLKNTLKDIEIKTDNITFEAECFEMCNLGTNIILYAYQKGWHIAAEYEEVISGTSTEKR